MLRAPNQTEYLAFLRNVVGIPLKNFPTVQGIATGGSLTTLDDSTQALIANAWTGDGLLDTSIGQFGFITTNTPTEFTFPAVTLPIVAGDAYLVAPPEFYSTYNIALATVNEALAVGDGRHANIYALAIYNLGAHMLMIYGDDVPSQTFFSDLRSKYRLNEVRVGVAAAVSDNGTSNALLNPEFMKNLTLDDLEYLKTPYGRRYMGFANAYGQTIWGLT